MVLGYFFAIHHEPQLTKGLCLAGSMLAYILIHTNTRGYIPGIQIKISKRVISIVHPQLIPMIHSFCGEYMKDYHV